MKEMRSHLSDWQKLGKGDLYPAKYKDRKRISYLSSYVRETLFNSVCLHGIKSETFQGRTISANLNDNCNMLEQFLNIGIEFSSEPELLSSETAGLNARTSQVHSCFGKNLGFHNTEVPGQCWDSRCWWSLLALSRDLCLSYLCC
jgi:hypothetical protein